MRIQEIVSDVRSRVETVGKQYQGVFKTCIETQRKAIGVMTRNGQTLANTEIGAAKNVFAAARASFDKARTDGVRKVANDPQAYVPNGRDQIVSAYKDTIDLLVRTGNELTDVLTSGYKSVLDTLVGRTDTAKNSVRAKSTARKTTDTSDTSASKASTAKRKTAATRKTSAKSTTAKQANGKSTTASTASASTASDSSGS